MCDFSSREEVPSGEHIHARKLPNRFEEGSIHCASRYNNTPRHWRPCVIIAWQAGGLPGENNARCSVITSKIEGSFHLWGARSMMHYSIFHDFTVQLECKESWHQSDLQHLLISSKGRCYWVVFFGFNSKEWMCQGFKWSVLSSVLSRFSFPLFALLWALPSRLIPPAMMVLIHPE